MSQDIAHIVLTRFNIQTPGRERRTSARPGWLSERFDLFEKFCLPTVAAQTRTDFEWLVYFDRETPEEFRQRIDSYRYLPFLKPQFVTYEEMTKFREHLPTIFPQRPAWLLTTTLDNDDGWHREFVENLRDNVDLGTPQVLNFTQGLVYWDERIYLRDDPGNPFASFLEPFSDSPRTIWDEQHIHLDRLGPVKQIQAPPMWLQVVHGTNVSNRIRGDRVRQVGRLEDFPFAEKANVAESDWEIWFDRNVMSLQRDARDLAIWGYKKVRTLVKGSGPV